MDDRREFCESHKDKTNKIWDAIFGNGRAGLAVDMAKVKVTTKIILTLNLVMLSAIIKLVFFDN